MNRVVMTQEYDRDTDRQTLSQQRLCFTTLRGQKLSVVLVHSV